MAQEIIYVGLDTETTGFNGPQRDHGDKQGAGMHLLLQVAGRVMDSAFNVLETFDYMVEHDGVDFTKVCAPGNYAFHEKNKFWELYNSREKLPLDKITDFIVNFHLPNAIREIDISLLQGKGEVPDYRYGNKFALFLHGKSVAFDKDFMNHQMPDLAVKFSHQLSDISSIRTLLYPNKRFPNRLSRGVVTHKALDDVDAAIQDTAVLMEYLELTMPEGKWAYLEDAVAELKRRKSSNK